MPNAWVEHVRQYAKDNNLTYMCAIPYAKETYTKKDGTKSIPSKSLPPPKPKPKAKTKATTPEEPQKPITDREAYELFFESLGITSKSIRREIIFDINDLIKRYGEDGHGDKPKNMNKITYWVQHLDIMKYIK